MATSTGGGGGAIPAWKLRMMQQQRGAPGAMPPSSNPGSSSLDQAISRNSVASSSSSQDAADARAKLKKKMEAATLDPNLPPAFKVAIKGRLAFARQQERRKANDTWVSLNSSHINAESSRPVDYVNAEADDDSSFASMGEDSYEGEDGDAIIEEGDEEEED
ncbi:hypothetical protein IV203_004183 [Nitzschia inconspicua]|uniref:Uncharacterized protein n=1 Tax=Nitzschia inconspicua TaxID=303405 RepID=A0A9K3L3I5_9STRA|nr:hypothetical protein IV203_004183 [Nitzschia inconspicua]